MLNSNLSSRTAKQHNQNKSREIDSFLISMSFVDISDQFAYKEQKCAYTKQEQEMIKWQRIHSLIPKRSES